MTLNGSIIRINYLNNQKFIELSQDEKNRFETKFNIIHDRIPFLRNMSFDINKIINTGLINLVKDKRENFINQIYMDFVENLVINFGGQLIRDRKHSYNEAFIFNNENDYYDTLSLFVDYVNSLIPNYSLVNLMDMMNKKNYDFSKNEEFFKLFMWFRPEVEYFKKKDSFYTGVLKNLFIYFISRNELIVDYNYFSDLMNKLHDDKMLLDYYRMNYYNNEQEIPKDLIKRYNPNKKIIR